jgi:hypothetical protein
MSHCFSLLTVPSFIASNDLNASTADDVSRAVVYEHAIAHVVAAGIIGPGSRHFFIYSNFGEALAPPWFAPVQQQLNCIEASVATVSIIHYRQSVQGCLFLTGIFPIVKKYWQWRWEYLFFWHCPV